MTEMRLVTIEELGETPTCSQCFEEIHEDDFFQLLNAYHRKTHLHRNCVVAFATRILNEFEKL